MTREVSTQDGQQRHLVVAGNGMVGQRLVEAVRDRDAQRRWRVTVLPVAGHMMDVRGHAVVVDGRLLPLSTATMALLREPIGRPW